MADTELVYVGIKGQVVALSRATGKIIWKTKLGDGFLSGSSFVHVLVDGKDIFATTQGVISCLDAATGIVRWCNEMKGFGFGIASIATRNTCSRADLSAQKCSEDAESTVVVVAAAGT